jgi:lipopolysaccharide transport system permease protein
MNPSPADSGRTFATPITPPKGSIHLDFREISDYRELLYFLIWKNIKVRYKQTLIGAAWAVIQPFFMMVVFSLFFGKLARIPSQGLPYPIFYYSALLPWTYFANALSQATATMIENQRVITKVYFPRLLLPLSAVLSGLLDFLIAFCLLIGMMFFYGISPGWNILFFPCFILLAILTAFGVGLWFSALNALYRDVRYAVTFIIQVWMFLSPVAYPSSMVPEKFRWIYGLNPMAGVIDGFRWALIGKGKPPGLAFFISLLATLIVLWGGMVFFQRIESKIVDRV